MSQNKSKYPVQRKNLDLSQADREKSDISFGDTPAEYRSPAKMMQDMGFDPKSNMTPLQFLTAVINDDLEAIFENQKRRDNYRKKGGIGLQHRIECAKTAAKYYHSQMPSYSITKGDDDKFGDELAKAVSKGEQRVRTRRVTMEVIENISPDVPLQPASYPDAFDTEKNDIVYDMTETGDFNVGDTDYNPDDEE